MSGYSIKVAQMVQQHGHLALSGRVVNMGGQPNNCPSVDRVLRKIIFDGFLGLCGV
jgi:hypothetical protein